MLHSSQLPLWRAPAAIESLKQIPARAELYSSVCRSTIWNMQQCAALFGCQDRQKRCQQGHHSDSWLSVMELLTRNTWIPCVSVQLPERNFCCWNMLDPQFQTPDKSQLYNMVLLWNPKVAASGSQKSQTVSEFKMRNHCILLCAIPNQTVFMSGNLVIVYMLAN